MNETAEILKHVSTLSYFGIFGTAFLANVVIPVPEEIVIMAIGYGAGTGVLDFWIAYAVTVLGAFISDMAMYALSWHGNRLVRGAYEKFFSKIIPATPEFLSAHLGKIVFASRFMINLRFLGPFFAGQQKMPWKRFALIDLAAVVIDIGVFMWAGHYFANRIESIIAGVGQVKNVILVVVGLAVLWVATQSLKKFLVEDFRFAWKEEQEMQGHVRTMIPGVWRKKRE